MSKDKMIETWKMIFLHVRTLSRIFQEILVGSDHLLCHRDPFGCLGCAQPAMPSALAEWWPSARSRSDQRVFHGQCPWWKSSPRLKPDMKPAEVTLMFHQTWFAGKWTVEIVIFLLKHTKTSIHTGFSMAMFDYQRLIYVPCLPYWPIDQGCTEVWDHFLGHILGLNVDTTFHKNMEQQTCVW